MVAAAAAVAVVVIADAIFFHIRIFFYRFIHFNDAKFMHEPNTHDIYICTQKKYEA